MRNGASTSGVGVFGNRGVAQYPAACQCSVTKIAEGTAGRRCAANSTSKATVLAGQCDVVRQDGRSQMHRATHIAEGPTARFTAKRGTDLSRAPSATLGSVGREYAIADIDRTQPIVNGATVRRSTVARSCKWETAAPTAASLCAM